MLLKLLLITVPPILIFILLILLTLFLLILLLATWVEPPLHKLRLLKSRTGAHNEQKPDPDSLANV